LPLFVISLLASHDPPGVPRLQMKRILYISRPPGITSPSRVHGKVARKYYHRNSIGGDTHPAARGGYRGGPAILQPAPGSRSRGEDGADARVAGPPGGGSRRAQTGSGGG